MDSETGGKTIPVELTRSDMHYLLFSLRLRIKKDEKNLRSLMQKFGEEADVSNVTKRLNVAYRLTERFEELRGEV